MSYLGTKEFLLEAQRGNVAGITLIQKFGRNDAVPNGSWEFINLLGFTGWPLAAATTVRIKAGGDANDTAAGTGAREVTVEGIDDSFNEVSESIATAGAGASTATTALFWRVHRAWVSACGTYSAANTAAVTIENSAGGTDLIQIAADEGQSQFGGYTIPIGKTGYLLSLHVYVDSNKTANIRLFSRDDIDDTTAPMKSKRLRRFFDGVKGEMNYRPRGFGFAINAKADIWVEAYGDGAASHVSCDFELLIVDD